MGNDILRNETNVLQHIAQKRRNSSMNLWKSAKNEQKCMAMGENPSNAESNIRPLDKSSKSELLKCAILELNLVQFLQQLALH